MTQRTPSLLASDVTRPVRPWVYWICFEGFLLAMAWAGIKTSNSGNAGASEAALLLAATATTLVSLSRQLPAQNVLLAAAIVGVIGIIGQVFNPFGIPFGLTNGVSSSVASWVWVPAAWMIILFNSRGVARLILWRWRNTNTYGYWLLALTTLLAVAFVIGFEMFAASSFGWRRLGDSPLRLAGLATTSIVMSILVIPALIQKQPVEFSPDYHPLIVWLLLNLFFGTVVVATFTATASAGV